MTFITDTVAIGDAFESNDPVAMKAAGIRSIVCLNGQFAGCQPQDLDLDALTCFSFGDGAGNNPAHFDRAVNAVAEYGLRHPNVLVHCQFGMSRSVMVVAAYLVRRHGWSLRQALELIQTKRPEICSPGYLLEIWDVNDEGEIG